MPRPSQVYLVLIVGILSPLANGQQPKGPVDSQRHSIAGQTVHEFRGYYKREHSLIKPYQGSGVEHLWQVVGSAIMTPQHVRLTSDDRSRKGAIWSKTPVQSRDWEMIVTFKVTGSTGEMYGDGMAIWYAAEPFQLGDVFGSRDYFRGLGVFLDTYSNHNGPHKHGHPFISAMVSDGTAHYDHDTDGTHTQLGGGETGCEAKFRNRDFETQLLIRYVGDTLSLFTDVDGHSAWKECMSVEGVHLPTGYFLGFSAATGDLSDNHDIIGVKLFEQEFHRATRLDELDSSKIVPRAEFIAAPRDHTNDPRPSRLGWFGTIVLVMVAAVVVIGGLGFGVVYFQNKNQQQRKRFY